MKPDELARTAYTVECFLNALRLDDGPQRTQLEAGLVQWLGEDKNRDGYLVFHQGNLCQHRGRVVMHRQALPQAKQPRTLWCDRKKLSIIDSQAYLSGGKLLMLGTAGLILTLPGSSQAMPQKKERSSNNNNNNNNNNNG